MSLKHILAVSTVVLLAGTACVSKSEFNAFKAQLQTWVGPTGPNQSQYANLREWQLRVTDVLCRLEQLNDADDKHVDNIPDRLCPGGTGDPKGAPPPPPVFG
ncbi:MAG: hypothetical protein OER21_08540 [Gemmatimonadota bacterium]|nr:hypothetical protein [Gemmatimonadota bacterium]